MMVKRKRVGLSHWPPFIDVLTVLLMVTVLSYFLNSVLSFRNLQAIRAQQQQDRFRHEFHLRLKNEIDHNLVSMEELFGASLITFSNNVLFPTAVAKLRPNAYGLLNKFKEVLQMLEGDYTMISVEGHTDNQKLGSSQVFTDNWELSTARAANVVRFLLRGNSIDGRHISASGFSYYRPILGCSEQSQQLQKLAECNKTAKQRARNRRIEIRVLFAGKDNE